MSFLNSCEFFYLIQSDFIELVISGFPITLCMRVFGNCFVFFNVYCFFSLLICYFFFVIWTQIDVVIRFYCRFGILRIEYWAWWTLILLAIHLFCCIFVNCIVIYLFLFLFWFSVEWWFLFWFSIIITKFITYRCSCSFEFSSSF